MKTELTQKEAEELFIKALKNKDSVLSTHENYEEGEDKRIIKSCDFKFVLRNSDQLAILHNESIVIFLHYEQNKYDNLVILFNKKNTEIYNLLKQKAIKELKEMLK